MITNKNKRIPTNIITGFLGTGKTSSILNLLKQKPSNERWAILVNEFGEIGIDGSLFHANHSDTKDVFIHEVSGGCMCCTAGLSLQIALSLLLDEAKPDRLLIEPTGLGHPKEVFEVLNSNHYQSLLSLQKIITMVDARMLSQERFILNKTFQQQIEMADIIMGNKQDLYSISDNKMLEEYTKANCILHPQIHLSKNGVFDLSILEGDTLNSAPIKSTSHNIFLNKSTPSKSEIPNCGFLKAENKTQGYNSIGWRFLPTMIFDYHKLVAFLTSLKVDRMKAVFITKLGIFSFNLSTDNLTQTQLNDCKESRIEIISELIQDDLEFHLLQCIND